MRFNAINYILRLRNFAYLNPPFEDLHNYLGALFVLAQRKVQKNKYEYVSAQVGDYSLKKIESFIGQAYALEKARDSFYLRVTKPSDLEMMQRLYPDGRGKNEYNGEIIDMLFFRACDEDKSDFDKVAP